MVNFLNPLGLVAKYAITGAVSIVVGIFIASYLGMGVAMSYFVTAISGAIAGWLRQRKGKNS